MHTIIPPEILFQNEQTQNIKSECVSYNGVMLDVTPSDEGKYTINRIISTNLKDYLNDTLQPQHTINMHTTFK